jgi:hypothetical protein
MTIEHVQNLVIGSGVAGKILAWTLAAAPRQSGCWKLSGRVSRQGKFSRNASADAILHRR